MLHTVERIIWRWKFGKVRTVSFNEQAYLLCSLPPIIFPPSVGLASLVKPANGLIVKLGFVQEAKDFCWFALMITYLAQMINTRKISFFITSPLLRTPVIDELKIDAWWLRRRPSANVSNSLASAFTGILSTTTLRNGSGARPSTLGLAGVRYSQSISWTHDDACSDRCRICYIWTSFSYCSQLRILQKYTYILQPLEPHIQQWYPEAQGRKWKIILLMASPVLQSWLSNIGALAKVFWSVRELWSRLHYPRHAAEDGKSIYRGECWRCWSASVTPGIVAWRLWKCVRVKKVRKWIWSIH